MVSYHGVTGVYQILCVSTGKVYIGSSINIGDRWHEHQWHLIRGSHHSEYLQRAWNKYGSSNFCISVLEIVERQELLVAEQVWMDKLQSYDRAFGYNLCSIAGSILGIKRSEATKSKHRLAHARIYHGFVDPDGKTVVIHNLKDFCRRQGFNVELMYRLASNKGRIRSYRGWTFSGSADRQAVRLEGFISPEGSEVIIEDFTKFCLKQGLNLSHMRAVYQGK